MYYCSRTELEKLKQRVINLRQSEVALRGCEAHQKIWKELCELEEMLQYAAIIPIELENEKIITKPQIIR